ncbi:MAG TPA: hypothetical protein VFI47_14580, partial [Acidimicrobiales bacterium]|nr:hypothetical protein [Acidimicrobiales bacterium]
YCRPMLADHVEAPGIVDTMVGFPTDPDQLYAAMRRQLLRDRESQESFAMPAEYMFRDVPELHGSGDPVAVTPAIIDYANTRGADRVLYGGYFPMGLTRDRIMGELADVPLKDEVRPKFLRDNARPVLGLDAVAP